MEALNIKHLTKHYHLRPSQRDLQQRLDAALNDVMAEYLEKALTEEGVDGQEEVCVRLVHLPLVFTTGKSQYETSIQWSRLIAQTIRSLLDEGGDNVIRYPSRFNALIEFAEEVCLHRLQRKWAWNQLGLSALKNDASLTEAREQLAKALLREPAAILPTFSRIAQIQRLVNLLSEFSRHTVGALLKSALQLAGVDRHWLKVNLSTQSSTDRQTTPPLINGGTLSESVIFKHLQNNTINIDLDSASLTPREWVILILLEREPVLFRRSSLVISSAISAAELQVLALFSAKQNAAKEVVIDLTNSPELPDKERVTNSKINTANNPTLSENQLELQVDSKVDDTQGLTQYAETGKQQNGQTPLTDEVAGEQKNSLSSECHKVETSQKEAADSQVLDTVEITSNLEQKEIHSGDHEVGLIPEESITNNPESQKDIIHTEIAGLFFLLPVLGGKSGNCDQSSIDQIAADPAFNARSLSWILYQLTKHWLAIETSDPGLRIFCGVDIDIDWPWAEDEIVTVEENRALENYAEKIKDSILQKFAHTELNPASIIPYICHRSARILIDCGWLELIFSLNDVDTDIRRAGLDLDPGYVPWLGKVVKIRYE